MSRIASLTILILIAAPVFAERVYTPSSEPLANPERGLYVELDDRRGEPLEAEELERLTRQGITLIQRLYYLKSYRDRPLDETQLRLISGDFQTARQAGVKVVLRFAYSSRIGEPDAPLTVVLGHIEQLGPLLRDNADLLLTVQAGFIGAWGEWHASTNGLTEPAAMRQIANALLAELPTDRTVQLRTPHQKQIVLGVDEGPLPDPPIDRTLLASRLGHHNDCFLVDETDVGTYREGHVDAERAYVAADSAFVPVGGETCRLTDRSDPEFAREEMALMHWSFLNLAYHRGVIEKWRQSGFLDEVRQKLGYRLRLVSASFPETVGAAGPLTGELTFANDGWAAPINPRPLTICFVDKAGETRLALTAKTDLRDWRPGGPHMVRFDELPTGSLTPGVYRLWLWLPDASPRLENDPRYTLRLANADLPVDRVGRHDLGVEIEVLPR